MSLPIITDPVAPNCSLVRGSVAVDDLVVPNCSLSRKSPILSESTAAPVTFTEAWQFTDLGFIAGGQNGAARAYSDPSSVASSPWSFVTPDKLSLKLSYEPDYNCSGYNNYTQSGTATCVIRSSIDQIMTVTWSGMGERQDPGYELMSLTVDGVLVGYAHAPGGGLGCAGGMGPVISSPAPPQTIRLSANVDHTLVINGTTNDQYFNTGAYYQFALSFVAAGSGLSTNSLFSPSLPPAPTPR